MIVQRRRLAVHGDGWEQLIDSADLWYPTARSTLVVAPHPDDESLSCAGLIGLLRDQHAAVTVLAVTDGEAAYGLDDRATLGDRRRTEQLLALNDLGVPEPCIWRAGLPDGNVESHEDLLTQLIGRLIERLDIGRVVAPWHLDHHGDHEATGRAALAAAGSRGVELLATVFWGWFHAPAPTAGCHRVYRLPLARRDRRRKRAAILRHRSQLSGSPASEPVLGDVELALAMRPYEMYLGRPS